MAAELRQVVLDRRFFTGLGLFALFAVIAWLVFHFSSPTESLDEQRGKARSEKLAALRKENDAKVNRYAWLAKEKGTVQIPVTRAMELVVNDLKNKPVQASAVKVEDKYPFGLQTPPVPVAAASPNSSPAPAASATPSPAKTP